MNKPETLGGDGSCVRRRDPDPSKSVRPFVRVQRERYAVTYSTIVSLDSVRL